MTPPPWSDLVLNRLGRGRDAAITLGALQEVTGATRRQVEIALRDLRLDGWPVASASSGKRGVWMADSVELDQTISSLQRRLVSQYKTLRKMRERRDAMRLAEAKVEQTTLFGEAA